MLYVKPKIKDKRSVSFNFLEIFMRIKKGTRQNHARNQRSYPGELNESRKPLTRLIIIFTGSVINTIIFYSLT